MFEEISDTSMQCYLIEIGRYPVLTREQEQELAREAQAGNRDAYRRLVECNLRLVVSIAKRYKNSDMPLLELVQEGNLGLMRAVSKFNPALGFRFSTYATNWIRQAISRALSEMTIIRIPIHVVEVLRRMMRVTRQLYQDSGRDPTTGEIADAMGLPVQKVLELQAWAETPLSLDIPVGTRDEDDPLLLRIEDTRELSPGEALMRQEVHAHIERALHVLTERERRVLVLRYGLGETHAHTLMECQAVFGLTRERVRQIEVKALGKLAAPLRATQ